MFHEVEGPDCADFRQNIRLKLLVKLNDEMRPNELVRPTRAETAEIAR